MKTFLILTMSLLICSRHTQAQMNTKNFTVPVLSENSAAQPGFVARHKQLRLYYIKAKPELIKEMGTMGQKYLTLEKALKAKKIQVKEVDNGGQVNTLRFYNPSRDTIIISMGDLVKGGKQDRVIEKDTLIAPGKRIEIPVYCVEQGRWSENAGVVNTNNRNISVRNGSSASFSGYNSTASNTIRKSIVKEKSQQKVWDNVAQINSTFGASTQTGTYSALNNSVSYNEKLSEYLNYFKKQIEADKTITGILAVTGDRIIGCDIYASTKLFRENYINLLNSYITEALQDGSEITITDAEVFRYLNNLLEDEKKQDEVLKENGRSLKVNGKKIKITSF